MYSQQEIDDAVASGVITAQAADALRDHVERQRSSVIADEEQFRLITGFNDIFVSIAAAILLFAVGWIGQWIGQQSGLVLEDGPSPLAPLAVAATAWPLAMFFTAKRRMALPTILLLLAFVLGVFGTCALAIATAIGADNLNNNNLLSGIILAVSATVSAGAASASLAHVPCPDHDCSWRRFCCRNRSWNPSCRAGLRCRAGSKPHPWFRSPAGNWDVPVCHVVGQFGPITAYAA